MSEFEPIEVTVKSSAPLPAQDDYDLGQDPVQKTEPQKEQAAKPDEGVELLKRQLDEKRREADDARRARAEAEKYAHEAKQETKSYQVQAQDNQLTAFVNAIASFERDAEMLERDYASTLADGDYSRAAKLQRQMAQVESRLMQLAQGKEAVEEKLNYERQMLEHQRRQPQPRFEQQQIDPIEAQIQAVQSPTSQAWLRSHRDVLADPVKTSLMTAAHHESVAMGIRPDTPEYFAHIESKVYDAEPARQAAPTQKSGRQAMSAAPVSRTNSAQTFRSGQTINLTLSPAEREHAAAMDMTDEEYAENKLYYANKGQMSI
jgi:hypothetical protein